MAAKVGADVLELLSDAVVGIGGDGLTRLPHRCAATPAFAASCTVTAILRAVARTWRRAALIAAVALVHSGSAAWAAGKTTPVTLQLIWTHQAIFGGFYVADKKGLYAAEGLEVRFLEGGPDTDLLAAVVAGRAQFGIAAAGELLIARQDGKPIRAIATIFRRSPSVYVSKAGSGITRPQDFVGKTVRTTTVNSVSLLAMMRRAGIAPTQYHAVNLPSDAALFAARAADVWSVYSNNFALTLEQAGQKLNYIYPDDYGIHFYADTLFTTDALIAGQPDLVLRFLRASLRGWTIAVEDPPLVGALVRAYAPEADSATETLKMRATQILVNTGEDHIGWMRAERWMQMAQILEEQQLLAGSLPVTDVYTASFLQQIYRPAPGTP